VPLTCGMRLVACASSPSKRVRFAALQDAGPRKPLYRVTRESS